jgi:REP element-mobilizing transposase RayT
MSRVRVERNARAQQELFKPRRWGGKRAGAGRKPEGARTGSSHKQRPTIKAYYPMHVVMRVAPAVGSLRRRSMYRALRKASVITARRERFRICHISIQRTHVHMLVEAKDAQALARGMQGFQISAARQINTALGDRQHRRRGAVFPDRYHLEIITSPRRAHHALWYVLANWRKHGEDRHGVARSWAVDPFSSGIQFADWAERADKSFLWPIGDGYDPLMVRGPETWLLREGWKRHGTISVHDVPGKQA